jgi:Ca2+-binding RTX toxin-like protein
MAFATYFTGDISSSAVYSAEGAFTANIRENANGTVSGTWTLTADYTTSAGPGSIPLSGTLTGSPRPGNPNFWDVVFSGSSARLETSTGSLVYGNGQYLLDVDIGFDIPVVNFYGETVFQSFVLSPPNGDFLRATTLPPVISIDSYTGVVDENGSVNVTLKRSGSNLANESTVLLTAQDGTAVSSGSGWDFLAFPRVVTFAPNEKTKTVTFFAAIRDDSLVEGNESFAIYLGDPTNATLGFAQGNVTIRDNDTPLNLIGTSGPDNLVGSKNDDVLSGLGGNDTLIGGGGNDRLDGGADADVLNGDEGADTLIGGSGIDRLFGGSGNDVLIWDPQDARVDGGAGTDLLRIDGAGKTLNLLAVANSKIQNVEVIDLTGSGNNRLELSVQDVLDLSGSTNILRVIGNPGDVVDRNAGWKQSGLQTIGGVSYRTYTGGGATLLVDIDITVTT